MRAPLPEEWGGRGGTIAQIMSSLGFEYVKRNKIEKVLMETYKSIENDGTYDASWKKRGRTEILIKKGSIQEKQIADFSEHGVSLRDITCIFNEYLLQDAGSDLEVAVWFTKSAVEGAFNRMRKIEVPMTKRAQGSTDKNSHWAKARHRFIVQLQVCMGDNPDLTKFKKENGTRFIANATQEMGAARIANNLNSLETKMVITTKMVLCEMKQQHIALLNSTNRYD